MRFRTARCFRAQRHNSWPPISVGFSTGRPAESWRSGARQPVPRRRCHCVIRCSGVVRHPVPIRGVRRSPHRIHRGTHPSRPVCAANTKGHCGSRTTDAERSPPVDRRHPARPCGTERITHDPDVCRLCRRLGRPRAPAGSDVRFVVGVRHPGSVLRRIGTCDVRRRLCRAQLRRPEGGEHVPLAPARGDDQGARHGGDHAGATDPESCGCSERAPPWAGRSTSSRCESRERDPHRTTRCLSMQRWRPRTADRCGQPHCPNAQHTGRGQRPPWPVQAAMPK